jgi:2-polyprenyl-3-methyl-5-hydroxy-6-metoxy-1,4-benzoquinol methylase
MNQMNQKSHSKANRVAWSDPAYYALWCQRYGTPEVVAEEIARDPWCQLKRYRAHLGQVHGKRIVNLLGSIGRKAVPLALLGADVTVVDASPVNERFAEALAESAGVSIRYIVSEVLDVELRHLGEPFDVVLMEGGILGYFVDLAPLAELCFDLARPGGRLVLGEMHPIRKCVKTQNGVAHLEGSYFDRTIHEGTLPLVCLKSGSDLSEYPATRSRLWTMAEIITAFARAGFVLRVLEETPGDVPEIPGMFHLVAGKPTYALDTRHGIEQSLAADGEDATAEE